MDQANPRAKPQLAPTQRASEPVKPTSKTRGRPIGALGAPQRLDLEALWLIYDLQNCGMQFKEALNELKDFAHPSTESILTDADRTTHSKRLRRWAARYPRKNDLLKMLRPELFITFTESFPLPEGWLRVPAPPEAELCNGTEIW